MEKTCAAEENRTTDTMWVEKRGKYSEQKGALRCAKKNMTKKRWVDRSRDSYLMYHQPHVKGHLRTLLKTLYIYVCVYIYIKDQKEILERKKVK